MLRDMDVGYKFSKWKMKLQVLNLKCSLSRFQLQVDKMVHFTNSSAVHKQAEDEHLFLLGMRVRMSCLAPAIVAGS